MSPQFVDHDGDKKLDVLAGTFDGSPHVALAGEGGWGEPAWILDKEGQRIVMNQFWNTESKPGKWDETKRCDPKDHALPKGHLTSAWAWDWDADGDLDLLLGDYDGGHLYLRRNEGKAGAAAYATTNEVVFAGGKPLHVNKTSTPRMVDFDGDGMLDLVVGSMGDSYGTAAGGGVHWFRNTGKQGAPEFAAGVDLVPPSTKELADEPTRPDAGLYMDLADVDGDGDLDMVVGAYSWSKPSGEPKASNPKGEPKPVKAPFVWFHENRTKSRNASAPASPGK